MWKRPFPSLRRQVDRQGFQYTICRAASTASIKNVTGGEGDNTYWQRSRIPTMHFQPSLLRLPIPKLELTMERYLAAQRPLLIDECYRKTEANVNRFMAHAGSQLQALLLERDKKNKHTSYISDMWFDMYLRDRKPLPLNYNPVLVLKSNDAASGHNDQLLRTANLLVSSLRFYKSLCANLLEPDVYHLNARKSDTRAFRTICATLPAQVSSYAAYAYKAYPLDMSQYRNLFASTRVPELDKDRLVRAEVAAARHVMVMHRGRIYAVDVLDARDDSVLPPREIFARLKHVLETSGRAEPDPHPIGVLTTLDRNRWATLRHRLADNTANLTSLRQIDSALFCICLDDVELGEDKYAMMRNFLHGDGTNRWFDKSFSLQLSRDGIAAINFEHAWGDGVAVMRYLQDVYKDSTENPLVPIGHDGNASGDGVRLLELQLTDDLREAIDRTRVDFKRIVNSLSFNYTIDQRLSKALCKQKGVSPDAMMQLAIQSAHYKQFGRFVATYESCSTAAFRHGRTETIRPCTMATRDYCLAVNKPATATSSASLAEQFAMIRACSTKHMQLTREAAMGQGFDRHLYALRKLSEDRDEVRAAATCLFGDAAYERLQYNVLSTSTLSSPAIIAGGFAPVVSDGFGIGYVVRDEEIGTLATTYPSCDGAEFIRCLQDSVTEIVEALTATKSNGIE